MFKIWSGKTGSNRRPQPWQGCALPTELFPHFYRSLTFYNVVCCDGMNCSVVLGGFRKNATFFHLQCLTAGSTGLDSAGGGAAARSEEHTSELQSQSNLVCRLLLEKKKKQRQATRTWIRVWTRTCSTLTGDETNERTF